MNQKWIALLLALIMALSVCGCAADKPQTETAETTAAVETRTAAGQSTVTDEELTQTAQWLMEQIPQPTYGSVGGEWAVFGLARSGVAVPKEYFEVYGENVAAYTAEHGGVLHAKKYTEYSRVILAWTALGKDAADVGGFNLLVPLADFDQTVFQGINGPIFALLNGAPDISAETKETIRKVASQMGYTPNSAARMLKTSRSYNFGVLFEDQANKGLTHSFFSHILNSFKHRAEELGYDISFISDHMGGQEISYVDHARYRNCDGVVIASVDYTEHAVVDLANSGIPVVTIDCVFENCGSVLSDNVGGMTELVKYAYSMGHRKIAFAYGEDTPVTRRRISGFCRACKELGLSLPDEYLVQSMYLDPESSAAATRKLMELPDPPTCILYPDDIAHLGGKNELEKMGLSVPDDVSIVGYDGIDFCQMLRPKLTTMRQDAERMGELAAEELARAVEEGRSYIPGRHVVGGTLLPGETVKKLTP